MSTMNYRRCSKCGKTRAEDPNVTFHRFPLPGTSNILKARAWATYCWPTKDWSYENLCLLNNRSSVLCGRHFSDSQFYDNNRQHLSKFAVPDSPEVEELLHNRENIFDPNKMEDDPPVTVFESSSKPVEEPSIVIDLPTSDMDLLEDPLGPTLEEQEEKCSAPITIMKESKRKCFRCGRSPHLDGVKLFRFPKPSVRNLIRCSLWAKFIFPDRDYSSLELQTKLHNEHRMLCQQHFLDAEFTDESKHKLIRSAVPSDNKEQDNPAVTLNSKPVEGRRIVIHPSTSDMELLEDPLPPTYKEQNKEQDNPAVTLNSKPVEGRRIVIHPSTSDMELLEDPLPPTYKEQNKEQDNPAVTLNSKSVEGRRIVIHPSTSDMELLEDPLPPTYKGEVKLEVCIDSLESAVNAIRGGADELELCSALNDGGLTPSVGLVKEALKLVKAESSQTKTKTKVNVMLRCRGGDDFQYTSYEMVTMLSDLQIFKAMGVDRFVFGALTDTLAVDEENCMKVLVKAQPIPVTFHRAFDLCVDPIQSIDTILNLGFDRLLTSGQQSTVNDTQAVKLIERLVDEYEEEIQIMPGSGVNCSNVKTFVDLGCSIVHSSCKKNRILPKIMGRDFTMGGTNEIYVTDESIVRQMKEILQG